MRVSYPIGKRESVCVYIRERMREKEREMIGQQKKTLRESYKCVSFLHCTHLTLDWKRLVVQCKMNLLLKIILKHI